MQVVCRTRATSREITESYISVMAQAGIPTLCTTMEEWISQSITHLETCTSRTNFLG
jgi:hypothetical protein